MFNLEDDMSLGFHDSGTSNHSSFPVMTHSPSPAPSISRASSHYKEVPLLCVLLFTNMIF